jgi:hypothetical protein
VDEIFCLKSWETEEYIRNPLSSPGSYSLTAIPDQGQNASREEKRPGPNPHGLCSRLLPEANLFVERIPAAVTTALSELPRTRSATR